ncbi:hypothetical protein D5086_018082 [Populus alba]|uniref:Uncharacterized protein n=1 Tax=Populus alba TaxID=43335 RepID=A0ACC4BP99_POPAL
MLLCPSSTFHLLMLSFDQVDNVKFLARVVSNGINVAGSAITVCLILFSQTTKSTLLGTRVFSGSNLLVVYLQPLRSPLPCIVIHKAAGPFADEGCLVSIIFVFNCDGSFRKRRHPVDRELNGSDAPTTDIKSGTHDLQNVNSHLAIIIFQVEIMRDSLLYKRGALSVCHLERQRMAFGVRLCLCLLLVFAVISSARNTISFSDNEMVLAVKGRSLKMTLNDYGEPTANRGHDPSQRNKNRGGRRG